MEEKVKTNLGYIKGEVCNRDGCTGILDEHVSETSCSCHINPPCLHCVNDRNYCPDCNWEGIQEQNKISEINASYYKKMMDDWWEARGLFYQKFAGKIPVEKLEIRIEAHTNFSQKVLGVFPIGTETATSLLPKVKGTFGGKFTRFDDYSFEYIAYTD